LSGLFLYMENKVETYISKHPKWIDLLSRLRSLLLSERLEETIKWGAPAYTLEGTNIVGMVAFKDYVCLWFYQGVFLKDPEKVLYNAQEGKTKALRQWRFESPDQVSEKIIKSYVKEAIENQKQGKVLKPEKGKALLIPDELQAALLSDQAAKKCFEELTLTKKREYTEYISEAKKTETKQKRIEKIIPMIIKKIGLHDQYKK
jgi:uncharacterized protein YdeI (YjbR/CyaY-like superfamily)